MVRTKRDCHVGATASHGRSVFREVSDGRDGAACQSVRCIVSSYAYCKKKETSIGHNKRENGRASMMKITARDDTALNQRKEEQ